MSLQALFDLKERLEHAAVAGTGLIREDFRLHRAAEALAPLAKANPVFARICSGITALLNAPEQERGAKLLDVLSLVDAVVYTQGTSGLPGDMELLTPGPGSYKQVSYGELRPLLAALNGSGSGRTAVVREYWSSHGEYFSDFRVLPAVIRALGDNYGELADLAGEILMKQGNGIVPLLKENFNPAGKAEMARRVRLITWKCAERENSWYIGILPDSTKEVREAIIAALGLSEENTPVLLDLCRTEKGKLKEMALRSLASMGNSDAAAFWEEELRKHPNSACALGGVDTPLAAGLVTTAMKDRLQMLLDRGKAFSGAELEQFLKLSNAFCGKYSNEVRDFWYWTAERMDQMHTVLPEHIVIGCDCSLAELMQRCFLLGILRNPCAGMIRLAKELSKSCGRWFLCGGLMAELMDLEGSGADTFERYSRYFTKNELTVQETEEQRWNRIQMMRALAPVTYSQEQKLFQVTYSHLDFTGNEREVIRFLRCFDVRWAGFLADHNLPQDGQVYYLRTFTSVQKRNTRVELLMMQLIDPEHPQTRQVCGAYLHKRAWITGHISDYQDALVRCGWKNWKGLLARSVQLSQQVVYHRMIYVLADMPISNSEKADELKEVQKLIALGSVSVRKGIWDSERISDLIAQLESG